MLKYKHKGLVLYFYALRSGYYFDTWNAYALTAEGGPYGYKTLVWLAVRPALQLAQNCHSEQREESRSIVEHFTFVQCDGCFYKRKVLYFNAKGLVFYFYALRSGYHNDTCDASAITAVGSRHGDRTSFWQAVRPALQLNCF